MPVLDGKGVLCCGPKVWTTIIGWLYIVSAVMLGVVATVAVFTPMLLIMSVPPEGIIGEEIQKAYGFGVAGIFIVWVLVGLSILVAALLLVGNTKERSGFLGPWLMFNWFGIFASGLGATWTLLTGQGWTLLFLVVDALIRGLFLTVVYERRKEILAAERKKTAFSCADF